ncbi:tryptophan synthase subunit beta [Pokkaliibacter plantistimulans]|uniref:Tryptophan synthase beta chain n=1 Tax=Pokkaliibacter plantistimulans TaxID=1635171 RepID=A0ABX5LXH4_9GAMM|nr:tryptophan synthase subunit beta [Pokkaliibacter plantistimulans]PXF31369.1 tryptophan synthase subunit beta [Pokkaliibacter plantistimulans]
MMSDNGYYGQYGGSYIPEILYTSQQQVQQAFDEARNDPAFIQALEQQWQQYSGRPTPLTFCANLTEHFGGAQIYLKREDLNHSGAHKMNNVIGQGLLVKRMGKKRVIAETGAGQHGIATALVAARLGLECTIYMGAKDVARQYPNVFWMRQLGATVIPVTTGSQTLRDALDEALRDWSGSYADSHYLIGTSCGCAPFPEMVSFFQSVIGREVRQQSQAQFGALPDRLYACVGGGSNACGLFLPFMDEAQVEKVGVEAGGKGMALGEHSIRLSHDLGQPGIAQGFASIFLQDNQGQLQETHSIAAGLDYVGVSPIIAHLAEQGQLRMTYASDQDVVDACTLLLRKEGIIPALESSHALAAAFREAGTLSPQQRIVINLSGRGDKDIFNVARAVQDAEFPQFLRSYLREYPDNLQLASDAGQGRAV